MFKVSLKKLKYIRDRSWSHSMYKTIFLSRDELLVANVTFVFGVVCRAFCERTLTRRARILRLLPYDVTSRTLSSPLSRFSATCRLYNLPSSRRRRRGVGGEEVGAMYFPGSQHCSSKLVSPLLLCSRGHCLR
jgi:hypothetical protein